MPTKKGGRPSTKGKKKASMPASSAEKNSIIVADDTTNVADKATSKVDTKVDTKVEAEIDAEVDSIVESKAVTIVASNVDNGAVAKVASKVADAIADSARTSIADSDHHSSSPLSTSPSTPPEKGQELDLDQPQLEDQGPMQIAPEEIAPKACEPVAIAPVGNTTNALILTNGLVENHQFRVENGVADSPKAPVILRPSEATFIKPPKNDRNNVNMNYDHANLEDITMRQLGEDVDAYEHDLNWCRTQLSGDDLTPQETRTLQLRTLDLTHQIRHCRHKIETMQFQSRKPLPGSALPRLGAFNNGYRAITNRESNGPNSSAIVGDKRRRSSRDELNNGARLDGTNDSRPALATTTNVSRDAKTISQTPNANGLKRPAPVDTGPASPTGSVSQSSKRPRVHVSLNPVTFDDSTNIEDIEGPILSMQRLGFWKCQLCLTPTYLLAGNGRSPAQPCKWPLKDISKMITHFTVMHGEHESEPRLAELGCALELNRGPFEYWLRRTRNAKIDDPNEINECIDALKAGRMPLMLRRLSNAAAKMQA